MTSGLSVSTPRPAPPREAQVSPQVRSRLIPGAGRSVTQGDAMRKTNSRNTSHSPEVQSRRRAARPAKLFGAKAGGRSQLHCVASPGPAGRSGGRSRCGAGQGAPEHARARSGAGDRAADGEAVARGCAPYLRCSPRAGGAGRRRRSRRRRRKGRRLLPGQRGPRLRPASSAAAAATALPGGGAHIPSRARGAWDPAPGGRGPQTSAGRAGPPRRPAPPPARRARPRANPESRTRGSLGPGPSPLPPRGRLPAVPGAAASRHAVRLGAPVSLPRPSAHEVPEPAPPFPRAPGRPCWGPGPSRAPVCPPACPPRGSAAPDTEQGRGLAAGRPPRGLQKLWPRHQGDCAPSRCFEGQLYYDLFPFLKPGAVRSNDAKA